jgi:hypothetical protein
LLIVRGTNWHHRSLSGKPVADSITDEQLTRLYVDSFPPVEGSKERET